MLPNHTALSVRTRSAPYFARVLFGLQAALGGRPIQPVIRRRHALLQRRVRNQVARDLLARELVERFVVQERPQDVVAIRPDGNGIVAVETAGVRVAHRIQPVHGLLLGERWRLEAVRPQVSRMHRDFCLTETRGPDRDLAEVR